MTDDHTTTTTDTLLSRPLKRKRIDDPPLPYVDDDQKQSQKRRQVRFDDQATQIITTYSSEEYDRGGIFSFPVLYKVNPAILQQPPIISPPKLSLDTHFSSSSSSSSSSLPNEKQSPQTPLEESPTTPPPPHHSKQRPKLTINTTNLTDHDGPAFLTRLSTSHHHHHHHPSGEDKANDYLVPLSAYSPRSFLPFF